ncbi:hypothetical protein [Amphritea sp.]
MEQLDEQYSQSKQHLLSAEEQLWLDGKLVLTEEFAERQPVTEQEEDA